MVDKTLQLEHNPVYTQNTDLFAIEKQKWSSFYARIRRHPQRYLINNTESDDSESDDDAGEMVRILEDEFQKALSLMAKVQAYFRVAYKVDILKKPELPRINIHFV